MAGLQRSAQTFRRSGSSGLVWDERFLTEGAAAAAAAAEVDGGGARGWGVVGSRCCGTRGASAASACCGAGRGEAERDDKKRTLAKPKQQKDEQKKQEEVLVVPAWKAFRTRDVAPAAEPPSPRVPGCCAPCAIFRGSGGAGSASSLPRRATKPRKR